MDTRLDQYSSKQRSYKDFLREQGKQQLSDLPSIPTAQPLVQPVQQAPQSAQNTFSLDDLQSALSALQGGNSQVFGPKPKGMSQDQWDGLCEAYAEQMTLGHRGVFPSAAAAAQNYQKQGNLLQDYNNAKPGDLIYFAPDQSNDNYGHVGIYNGNGMFTSATDNGVRQTDLNSWIQSTGQRPIGYVPQSAFTEKKPHNAAGKGGGNPFMDMLRNVGNTALGELDPANENVPLLGPIRKFNREHFGQQPYADPNLPWDKRLANALQQYGNSFMGAHGDFGGVGGQGGLMDVALKDKPSTSYTPTFMLNHSMNDEAIGQVASRLNPDGGKFIAHDGDIPQEVTYTDPIHGENQIRSILSKSGLLDSPIRTIPGYDDNLVARERFNIPYLTNLGKLGAGSDRDVYDLGNGSVLKIAKAARGLSQNDSEGDMYAPVPNVLEKGKNYVVAEKVDKPNDKTKQLVNDIESQLLAIRNPHAQISDVLNPLIEKYSNAGDEDTANLLSDLMNYDPMRGDLARIVNWGSKNGEPILLDGGALSGRTLDTYRGKTNMSDPDFRDAVYQSRAAKKSFGDTDKNTMYGLLPLLSILGLAGASQKKGATTQQQQ